MRKLLLVLCGFWILDAIVIVLIWTIAFPHLWGTVFGVLAAVGSITVAILCGVVAKIGWPLPPWPKLLKIPGLGLTGEDLALARRVDLRGLVLSHSAGKDDVVYARFAAISPCDLQHVIDILGRSPEMSDLCEHAKKLQPGT